MIGRAWIAISHEFLIDRLGLPKGTKLIRADMNDESFSLRLGVEGEGLPISQQSESVPRITVQYRIEEVDGMRRLFGAYSHATERDWLIEEHPIASPRVLEPAK